MAAAHIPSGNCAAWLSSFSPRRGGRETELEGLHHTLQRANTEWETAATESHSLTLFPQRSASRCHLCTGSTQHLKRKLCVYSLLFNCCVVLLSLCSTFTDSVLQKSCRKKKITSTSPKGGSVAPGGCQWPCGAATPRRRLDRCALAVHLCTCLKLPVELSSITGDAGEIKSL